LDNVQVRRRVLTLLYARHNADPHSAIEIDDLARQLNLPLNLVHGNVVYLSDPNKSLIQITRTDMGGRIYRFARITAAGIDLLDDPNEFNAKFPTQVTYQYVAGDNLEVTIGDNASEVVVGKDIVKLQFGAGHTLEELTTRFTETIKSRLGTHALQVDAVLAEMTRLITIVKSDSIDLGEVQRIKALLVQYEGSPAVATIALFSHPAIVEPIQRAVEQLIGHS
jgi:hypothetical protein